MMRAHSALSLALRPSAVLMMNPSDPSFTPSPEPLFANKNGTLVVCAFRYTAGEEI
jgi:hypothetical protein